jgi:hypothetical protein
MHGANLLDKIPRAVWRQKWGVHSKAVGDGRAALRYLAPYVFRVAIGNHRIVRVTAGEDGQAEVVFRYKPSGSRSYKTRKVSAEEFICLFLQHVLPSGFQKVRHFGFMHKRSKVNRDWLAMLVTVTLNLVYVLMVQATPEKEKNAMRCADCGGELTCLGFVKWQPKRHVEFDSS